MQKNPTIILVVAVALIGENGRILLQKRKFGGEHGGLWEFPGGKVEMGETPEEALIREIYEELGVGISPDDLRPVGYAGNQHQPHLILLYLCRHWTGNLQCLDAEAIGWFAKDDLAKLEMPPLDYPLVKALLKMI